MVGQRTQHKFSQQRLLDALAWVTACCAAGLFRYEFEVSRTPFLSLLLVGVALAFVFYIVGSTVSLYKSRHKTGSIHELWTLLLATGLVATPSAIINILFGPDWEIPRSIVFIATPLFVLLAGGFRSAQRRSSSGIKSPHWGEPVVIYGAGKMAELLIPQLLEDATARFRPVGLIDDDPTLSNRWISGVKTLGTFEEVSAIVSKTGATHLIVAIPQAGAALLQRVRDATAPLDVKVMILPSLSEVLSHSSGNFSLRALAFEDLVGRRAVRVDSPKIQQLISNKKVLITGAGGSIGQELCQQVSRYNPAEIVFLDRDESGLQQAQLATERSGLLDNPNIVLADIRDSEVLEDIWSQFRPDIVFHAAALKHVSTLERFPDEAWKTNVQGTLNVLQASLSSGVETLVNISTDKAADPSSVLGRSKLLGEKLTAWAGTKSEGNYMSVRFGNVLGSRGSLIPTLSYLIENNLPLTLTHPEATRYFMTSEEACELVLQAGTQNAANSIFILDMGKPVKIQDIAERLVRNSGQKTEIVYTGLRQGEKLHETLHSADVTLVESEHKLIWTTESEMLQPSDLPAIRKHWLSN